MKELRVGLEGRSYDIHIAPGLLSQAGEHCRAALPRARRLAVVTDSNVGPLYAAPLLESLEKAGFQAELIIIPAGESSKCLAMLGSLYDAFTSQGLTRTDAVVALGGGVVGDLAGFAAATIFRGVDFVQIPTTLLAQVDSSVGGKVAIDLPAGKNLAGAFWQPRLVLMDPKCLETLDDKIFSDGMAEVIKYGCIWDPDFFATLDRCGTRAGVMASIEEILYTCCDIKRRVVEEDELDTGLRMILNFGHTLGHAFEQAFHYETYTHGQAVAAGMNCAAQLGVRAGITPPEVVQPIIDLMEKFGLPSHIPCPWQSFVDAIGLDKKGSGDQITMIFLSALGKAAPTPMKKDDVLQLLECLYGR